MEELISAVKANIDADGKLDLDKATADIKTAFPKIAVPKEQYNTVADKLKTANDTLTKLQDENKDVETLQKQIDDYKAQVETKDKELLATKNAASLKEALREAGATDIDYAVFKLGELETDADGNYKDLDNKIKAFKEASPTWFADGEGEGGEDTKDKNGFKVIDNSLKNGKQSKEKEPETLGAALAAHYEKK